MPRLAWLTDIHLNFVKPDRLAELANQIEVAKPDSVLIGGDIGEAPSFSRYLDDLTARLNVPVYFVLGNHDYYRGSISDVRETARSLSRDSQFLHWLPDSGVVRITQNATLIGHGGWGDGRIGDFLTSSVVLNDYVLIDELRSVTLQEGRLTAVDLANRPLPVELLKTLNALGDEAAEHFRRNLTQAADTSNNIWVLTHVPPFREACWHEGKMSDDNWAPHFSCQAVGDVLAEFMQRHPDHDMTVLCGHTHGEGRTQILPNLEVITGGAEYGEPVVQQVFDIE